MKIQAQFHPIYAQGAGRNVAIADADIVKTILEAVIARADLVFQGEDGIVTYRTTANSQEGRGRLNIQLQD